MFVPASSTLIAFYGLPIIFQKNYRYGVHQTNLTQTLKGSSVFVSH